MADNHNPTPQDLEALDALMRRALLLGEYHSFMDGVSLVYLHRVVQAARREAAAETAGEAVDEAAAGEVKPCPFCGGVSVRVKEQPRHGTYVICDDCQAAGPYKRVTGTEEDATEAWNARTTPPVPAQDDDKLRIAELSASMTQQSDQWSERLSVMAGRAAAAEARADRLAKALERQADNMAFVLNHANIGTWFDKFTTELAEARAALQQEG